MNRWFRWLFWGLCAATMVLALLPGAYLPPSLFNWWDKAQHALAFLALGGLGLLAYSKSARLLLMGLLLFGACIEFAQAATGWRFGDVQDWFADAVGVAAAYAMWWVYKVARNARSLSEAVGTRDPLTAEMLIRKVHRHPTLTAIVLGTVFAAVAAYVAVGMAT